MTFKTFSLALLVSFGFPWLTMVVIPFASMRNLAPVKFANPDGDPADAEVYVPRRSGRIPDGAAVYAANGCYVCHTQLIRPSFAGSDLGRPGWAGYVGLDDSEIPVDRRRETTPFDFTGEKFAQIGLMRNGPDLSNVGNRVESYVKDKEAKITNPELWLYRHFYSPRKSFSAGNVNTYWSTCPSLRYLFKSVPVRGQGSAEAIPGVGRDGKEVVPTDEARALASYLLSMQKDDTVPGPINFSRNPKTPE